MLGNNCNCFSLAQEKDADLALKTDDSTADDELTPEGQEDDGDWEQVGPRNKSMVTRMVRCRVSLITFFKTVLLVSLLLNRILSC